MATGLPTSPLPRCAGRAAAFTLIELVLVLALIGIVLAAAVPSMRGFVASRNAADTASQVLALTKCARGQAIAAGRPCRLNIDGAAGSFWLSVQQNGTFVEVQSDPGSRITPVDGVTISLRSEGPPRVDETPCVEFQPSGRCAASTIEVRGRGGELYLVTCASPTEAFHIVTPAEGAP
ncbi:MAG: prepilin-type N-terminal cleavage/methylation domain-containing protein [Planctomycetaceae bacterium]|nr:prepilin-type N-terminal cleavage/methylation domain-containing protein [Planctomycetaceae bacterium]